MEKRPESILLSGALKCVSTMTMIVLVLLPVALLARERWVYRCDGSGSDEDDAQEIAYGPDGEIYVAGRVRYAEGNGDLVVVSFTPGGDTNWFYRYDGPGSLWDGAHCLVCGQDGNIYSGGYSTGADTSQAFTVVSLTNSGDTNWTYRHDVGYQGDAAFAITCGADGNIYAAGRIEYDYWAAVLAVVSLSPGGDTNWIYEYDGHPSGYDGANSVVYGSDDNVYVAGSGSASFTNQDFVVISLSTAGDTNWTYRYDGPAGNQDGATSVVYGDGNVYAAGYSYDIGGNPDILVMSLSATGSTNWIYRYDGPGNNYDMAASVAYGQDGNLYVAGTSYGSAMNSDFLVICLTTLGDTNWICRYDGPANGGDAAETIVYGVDGNLYVAGSRRSIALNSDFTVISLTTEGDTNWTYAYDGPGNSSDMATSIVYGLDGNVYAAGVSNGGVTDDDFVVVSVSADIEPPSVPLLISPDSASVLGDSTATLVWHSAFDVGSGVEKYILEHSLNVSFTHTDSAVVEDTSYLSAFADTTHYWRVKAIDSLGYESIWSTSWNFTIDTQLPLITNTTDWHDTSFTGPFAVQATLTDNVGVGTAELIYRTNLDTDWVHLSMDTVGLPTGQYTVEMPAQEANTTIWYYVYCEDVATPPNASTDPENAPDTSYSFIAGRTGLAEYTLEMRKPLFISESSPNPFTERTRIAYSLPEDSWVNIVIYNLSGQIVRTLHDQAETEGLHTVIWNGTDDMGREVSSGSYFLRLTIRSTNPGADFNRSVRQRQACERTATRKLSIVR